MVSEQCILGMMGKMESRVIVVEEKLLEMGERQVTMETKMEEQFNEAKVARDELRERFDELFEQMRLILSKMDASSEGKTSSLERMISDKGEKPVGSSATKSKQNGNH